MARLLRVSLVVVLFCLATSHVALADPITLTGGSILVTGKVETGPATLRGTRGFTLNGLVDPGEGRVDPMQVCGQPEGCAPGDTVSLTAVLADPAWPNTVVTLDGKTYENIYDANSPATMFLHLSGQAMLPTQVGSPFVLTAPFAVEYSVFNRSFPEESVEITGPGGVALMWFTPTMYENGAPTRWFLNQVRYEFSEVAPVPEPGTWLLLATGAAGIARRIRQRRAGS